MCSDVTADFVSELANLTRDQLKQNWQEAFGSLPPLYLSLNFMRRVLGHHHQSRTYGRHSIATRRALIAIAGGGDGAVRTVCKGAHLVREWNGRTFRVEVIDGGYRFDGKNYASLSAIAKRITGTNWSGPRFFGLTAKRRG